MKTLRSMISVLVAFALVLAACGDDGSAPEAAAEAAEPAATIVTTTTVPPTTTTEPPPTTTTSHCDGRSASPASLGAAASHQKGDVLKSG